MKFNTLYTQVMEQFGSDPDKEASKANQMKSAVASKKAILYKKKAANQPVSASEEQDVGKSEVAADEQEATALTKKAEQIKANAKKIQGRV